MKLHDIIWNREVGTIGGVPIRLDLTYVAMLAFGVAFTALALPEDLAAPLRWAYAVGAIAAVGLSHMLHFLAQFITARRQGLEPGTLALSMIGAGVEAPGRPLDPAAALRCALAGPLVSLLVGAGPAVIWFALHNSAGVLVDLIGIVAVVNGVLAVVGLIPAYPLRGANIAQALFWFRSGREMRAMLYAARVGIGVGLAICAFGLTELFLRYVPVDFEFPLVGLWFSLTGLFCAVWSLSRARFAQSWLWLEEVWPEWNQPGAEPPAPEIAVERARRTQHAKRGNERFRGR